MEEVKAGDTVVVNGEPAKVTSVESVGEKVALVGQAAGRLGIAAGVAAAQLDEWNQAVRTILAKSKRVKVEDLKEDAVPPAPEVKYVAYALDNQGRLAMGRPHGRRRKPHWSPAMNALKSRTVDMFKKEFEDHYRVAEHDAAAEGRVFEGLGEQETMVLFATANRLAMIEHDLHKKNGRRARNARRTAARRINAGTTVANQDRSTVSAAPGKRTPRAWPRPEVSRPSIAA